MSKMHKDELEVNENFVRSLLETQCPQLANLPLTAISSSGTDHTLFRLGDVLIVRLPRVEWSVGYVNKNIDKEYKWLPQISKFMHVPISEPLFKGVADKNYPWSWTITKWNDGHNPTFEQDTEYELLAKDLAYFVNDLHRIQLSGGPFSRRGILLKELHVETMKAIDELEWEIDIQSVTTLWYQLSNTPAWGRDPVWVHGDLLPGNILVQNNRLSGVIDFSDVGIGDPACDLIIAWSLFNSQSRRKFRENLENLENIDDDTWQRGRGWALLIALIMLPYYKHSNSVLVSLAKQMISNVLSEV